MVSRSNCRYNKINMPTPKMRGRTYLTMYDRILFKVRYFQINVVNLRFTRRNRSLLPVVACNR